MTASNAQAIGNNGKGLDSYILEIMSQKYATKQDDQYSNSDIERGHELEAQAISIYELEQGVTAERVGFISEGDYLGCSPDSLIGQDGGLEIKCHSNTKHFNLICNGAKALDTKYIWQVQMNLLLTGRKWWDLVAYNPNFEKSLLVFRIETSNKHFESLSKGFEIGIEKIKEIELKI